MIACHSEPASAGEESAAFCGRIDIRPHPFSAATRDASPRTASSLFLHLPERADSKPGKRYCEANRNRYAPPPRLPAMVFPILFCRGARETQSHNQEHNPCNLQPQLVQYAAESPPGSGGGLGGRAHRPAALGQLRCHPRRHCYLSSSRNLAHGLDFNSLQRYNGANLWLPAKLSGG